MEIPFKGQYQQAEFYQAVLLANRAASRSQWSNLMLTAALLAVIFLSGQSVFGGPGLLADRYIFVRIGLALLLLLVFLLFDPLRAYLQTRRLWQNPAMQQHISGRVSSDGIIYTNTSPYRTVPWERFARLRLNGRLATMLTRDGVLTVLPRRFFKSESDWQAFCKLAKSKLSPPPATL